LEEANRLKKTNFVEMKQQTSKEERTTFKKFEVKTFDNLSCVLIALYRQRFPILFAQQKSDLNKK
jgi:hypothetical protein